MDLFLGKVQTNPRGNNRCIPAEFLEKLWRIFIFGRLIAEEISGIGAVGGSHRRMRLVISDAV